MLRSSKPDKSSDACSASDAGFWSVAGRGTALAYVRRLVVVHREMGVVRSIWTRGARRRSVRRLAMVAVWRGGDRSMVTPRSVPMAVDRWVR